VRLQAVAMGLLQHVRSSKVEQMARLLMVLEDTQDPVAAISLLLRVRRRRAARAGPRPAAGGPCWAGLYGEGGRRPRVRVRVRAAGCPL
jgi:hypothetical protein